MPAVFRRINFTTANVEKGISGVILNLKIGNICSSSVHFVSAIRRSIDFTSSGKASSIFSLFLELALAVIVRTCLGYSHGTFSITIVINSS